MEQGELYSSNEWNQDQSEFGLVPSLTAHSRFPLNVIPHPCFYTYSEKTHLDHRV